MGDEQNSEFPASHPRLSIREVPSLMPRLLPLSFSSNARRTFCNFNFAFKSLRSTQSSPLGSLPTPYKVPYCSCRVNSGLETTSHSEPLLIPNFLSQLDYNSLKCSQSSGLAPLKVAVLLSGGVDSSVALRLLQAAGHTCTAFYLKIWFQEDFRNTWAQCPWEEDLAFAREVCSSAGVELREVHLSDEYWERVVSFCVGEMSQGRTPNPDVLCNSRVKFGEAEDPLALISIAVDFYVN